MLTAQKTLDTELFDCSSISRLDLGTNELGEWLPPQNGYVHGDLCFQYLDFSDDVPSDDTVSRLVEMIFTFKTVRSSFFEKSSTFRQFSKLKLFWQ